MRNASHRRLSQAQREEILSILHSARFCDHSPASNGIFKSGFQTGDTPYGAPTGGSTRYIYLGRHLIADDGTRGRQYLHTDALGSPVRTTTATGAPSERGLYKPYGWGTDAESRPGFTGHVADKETGLIYMQARYYDPYAGRFLAVDPVAASAESFNRYWYANSNPYRDVDPDGRQADRAYGAAVGFMLRNDPERMRIWAGGEAAATTEGSLAEQGAAMGQAIGSFIDTGDYSKEAVATLAATVVIGVITRGKSSHMPCTVHPPRQRGDSYQ